MQGNNAGFILSINLSVSVSVSVSVCLSVRLLSVCLSVCCLSVCLHNHLFLIPQVHLATPTVLHGFIPWLLQILLTYWSSFCWMDFCLIWSNFLLAWEGVSRVMTFYFVEGTRALSQYKDLLSGMGIPMLKMSWDRLFFNMGIPILVRRHLYIETAQTIVLVSQTSKVDSPHRWGCNGMFCDIKENLSKTVNWLVPLYCHWCKIEKNGLSNPPFHLVARLFIISSQVLGAALRYHPE